jgi:hypothetical protein
LSSLFFRRRPISARLILDDLKPDSDFNTRMTPAPIRIPALTTAEQVIPPALLENLAAVAAFDYIALHGSLQNGPSKR